MTMFALHHMFEHKDLLVILNNRLIAREPIESYNKLTVTLLRVYLLAGHLSLKNALRGSTLHTGSASSGEKHDAAYPVYHHI